MSGSLAQGILSDIYPHKIVSHIYSTWSRRNMSVVYLGRIGSLQFSFNESSAGLRGSEGQVLSCTRAETVHIRSQPIYVQMKDLVRRG